MKEHLTPQQIFKWLAGDSSPEERSHTHNCPACADELAALENSLSQFRSCVTDWAGKERPAELTDTEALFRASHSAYIRRLRWAAVAAAIGTISIVPVYRNSLEERRRAEVRQELESDAELLARVNARLSQTAPVSLQRLTELVSVMDNQKSEGER